MTIYEAKINQKFTMNGGWLECQWKTISVMTINFQIVVIK